MTLYFIIGWCIFLVILYLGMCIEYAYYQYNLPQKFHAIMEAFTEEESNEE